MDSQTAAGAGYRRPWGLVGAVVLVAGVELGFLRGNLELTGNHNECWRQTGQMSWRVAPRKEVLCFGSSLVKFGVFPRVIEGRTKRSTYNLAVLTGSPASSYFLFRRAVEAGARPKAVVVEFARIIASDGPASPRRTYPWADLLSTREAADLCWTARDADLFASIMTRKVLRSLRNRFEIRAAVMALVKRQKLIQADINRVSLQNWRANLGAVVAPKSGRYPDPTAPAGSARRAGDWRCDPVNEVFIRRFLDLAAAHRLEVFWLIPPVAPGLQSQYDASGDEDLYDRFVRGLVARYPGLVVADARGSGYEAKVFTDGVHMDWVGAVALSCDLADLLIDPGVRTGDRWARLPPYRGRRKEFYPVEDITRSRLVVQDPGAATRR